MTKTFIFDMDGTIVNNISFHQQAWLKFLKNNSIDLNPDEFHAVNKGTAEQMIVHFFGQGLSPEKVKSLGREKEALYRELYQDAVQELSGFTRLLEIAKSKNIKIGLATNSNIENLNFIIDSLEVRPYFDMMVCGDEVAEGKPHPEIYQRILSALKTDAAHCIAFEDSHGGVISAQKAGIPVIGVCTSHSRQEFKSWGVGRCIDHFEEYINSLEEDISELRDL